MYYHQKPEMPFNREVADVAIYLLRICDVLDIDLEDAMARKLAINELKRSNVSS